MPQVFQILKCFKCHIFQVQQVKKSNKWECKVCGEKQSIKRHYGIGTAKDCRLHVQKLNSINGEINKTEIKSDSEKYESSCSSISNECNTQNLPTRKISKWSSYIDETHENVQGSKDVLLVHDSLKSSSKCNKRNKKDNNNENYKEETATENFPLEIIENHNSDLYFDNSNFQSVNSGNQCISLSSDILMVAEERDVGSKNYVCKSEKAPMIKISKWQQFLDEKENENCFENDAACLSHTVAADSTKYLACMPNLHQDFLKLEDNTNLINDNRNVRVTSKLNSMFSMCDDSDIDDVLKL